MTEDRSAAAQPADVDKLDAAPRESRYRTHPKNRRTPAGQRDRLPCSRISD
jgi:hypothetical protein